MSNGAPNAVSGVVGLEMRRSNLLEPVQLRELVGAGYMTGGRMPEDVVGYHVTPERWPAVHAYLEQHALSYKLHIPAKQGVDEGQEYRCYGADW